MTMTITITTTMFSLMLASAPPLGDAPTDTALNARAALWRSRAQTHEASQQWCDALFYRGHALAAAPDDATNRYHAFLDAYAADQLRTANALARDLDIEAIGLDDDARNKVELILSDLASLSALEDAHCSHTPVCGDGLVEGQEMCDAVDPGCTSTCELVAAVTLPRVALKEPAGKVSSSTTGARSKPVPQAVEEQGLVVAGVVATGAGLATAGGGAAMALITDQTIADPFTSGEFKERAMSERTAAWVAMGIGAAAVAMGAGLFALDFATSDDDGRRP